MNVKPGDEVTVKVNGKEYLTVIDERGVQRFKVNTVLTHLYEAGAIDMNKLAMAYHEGQFTKEDYAEFNMMIGYSVSGFCDLSSFEDYVVENPLWK